MERAYSELKHLFFHTYQNPNRKTSGDFDEFMEDMGCKVLSTTRNNMQFRLFVGTPPMQKEKRLTIDRSDVKWDVELKESHLQEAVENMKNTTFLGVLAHLPKLVNQINDACGFDLKVGKENVTKKLDVGTKWNAFIRQHIQWDLRLYDEALKILDQRWR